MAGRQLVGLGVWRSVFSKPCALSEESSVITSRCVSGSSKLTTMVQANVENKMNQHSSTMLTVYLDHTGRRYLVLTTKTPVPAIIVGKSLTSHSAKTVIQSRSQTGSTHFAE